MSDQGRVLLDARLVELEDALKAANKYVLQMGDLEKELKRKNKRLTEDLSVARQSLYKACEQRNSFMREAKRLREALEDGDG